MQNENKLSQVIFLICVLVAAIMVYNQMAIKPGPGPKPNPNVIPQPTRFLGNVQPIVAAPIGPEDAKALTDFYVSLSNRIAADSAGKLNSLEVLVKAHGDSGVMRFQGTKTFLAYESLRKPVNDVLAAGAGVTPTADGKYPRASIDGTNRQTLVEALLAIAWACQQHI